MGFNSGLIKIFISPASDCTLLATANLCLHWLHVCRHKFIIANYKMFAIKKIRLKFEKFKILS